MMSLTLQCNMVQRQTLLQELGLRSDLFENALVRTEAMLKKSKYQKSLRVIRSLLGEDDYNGVIDALVALLSPAWREHILAYYADLGPRLIEQADWATIERMDFVACSLLEELAALYKLYWQEGLYRTEEDSVPEYEELTAAGLKFFFHGRMPDAPVLSDVIERRNP